MAGSGSGPVNLNRYRKEKARAEKKARADQNEQWDQGVGGKYQHLRDNRRPDIGAQKQCQTGSGHENTTGGKGRGEECHGGRTLQEKRGACAAQQGCGPGLSDSAKRAAQLSHVTTFDPRADQPNRPQEEGNGTSEIEEECDHEKLFFCWSWLGGQKRDAICKCLSQVAD